MPARVRVRVHALLPTFAALIPKIRSNLNEGSGFYSAE
jgi:hypothetical protein